MAEKTTNETQLSDVIEFTIESDLEKSPEVIKTPPSASSIISEVTGTPPSTSKADEIHHDTPRPPKTNQRTSPGEQDDGEAILMCQILIRSRIQGTTETDINLDNIAGILSQADNETKQSIHTSLAHIPNSALKQLTLALTQIDTRQPDSKRVKLVHQTSLKFKNTIYQHQGSILRQKLQIYTDTYSNQSLLYCTDEQFVKQLCSAILMVHDHVVKASLVIQLQPHVAQEHGQAIMALRILGQKQIKLKICNQLPNGNIYRLRQYNPTDANGTILYLNAVHISFAK